VGVFAVPQAVNACRRWGTYRWPRLCVRQAVLGGRAGFERNVSRRGLIRRIVRTQSADKRTPVHAILEKYVCGPDRRLPSRVIDKVDVDEPLELDVVGLGAARYVVEDGVNVFARAHHGRGLTRDHLPLALVVVVERFPEPSKLHLTSDSPKIEVLGSCSRLLLIGRNTKRLWCYLAPCAVPVSAGGLDPQQLHRHES